MDVTYSRARAHLKTLMDDAVGSGEPIFIRRRHGGDVALVSADELQGLLETAHLLRSPRNARRLLRALRRARTTRIPAQSVDQLRRTIGLGGEKA